MPPSRHGRVILIGASKQQRRHAARGSYAKTDRGARPESGQNRGARCPGSRSPRYIRRQAPIAQLAEAADLKSVQCRFESDWGHADNHSLVPIGRIRAALSAGRRPKTLAGHRSILDTLCCGCRFGEAALRGKDVGDREITVHASTTYVGRTRDRGSGHQDQMVASRTGV